MNSTSRACRSVSIAARSPGFSMTGRPSRGPARRARWRSRRRAWSCRGRAGREQDVIERFAALLAACDRHLQVFADAVLADVVVEVRGRRPASYCASSSTRAGGDQTRIGHRRRDSCRSSAAQSVFEARFGVAGFERRSIDRLLGLRPMVAQIDQRRDQVVAQSPSAALGAAAGRDGRSTSAAGPCSSRTMRSAVFLPMPGIATRRATSPRGSRRTSSRGSMPDNTASASFGPMPLTADQPIEQRQLERPWQSRTAAARPRARACGRAGRPRPRARRRCRSESGTCSS